MTKLTAAQYDDLIDAIVEEASAVIPDEAMGRSNGNPAHEAIDLCIFLYGEIARLRDDLDALYDRHADLKDQVNG